MKAKLIMVLVSVVVLAGGVSATLGSPSQVNVQACTEFFDNCDSEERVITMEWTADAFDSSEVVVGADQINSRIDTGEVNDNFRIRIDSKTSEAQYDIRDGGRDPFRGIDARTNEWAWCLSSFCNEYPQVDSEEEYKNIVNTWLRENGEDLDGDTYFGTHKQYWTSGTLGNVQHARAYTVEEGDLYAHVGEIESRPQEIMSATFNVGGIEKTISNSYEESDTNPKTANFGNQVKINFRGGLESGYDFPTPTDELVAYHEGNLNGFRVIDSSGYETDYQNALDNADDSSTVEDWANGVMDEQAYEDQVLQVMQDATSTYTNSEFVNGRTSFNSAGSLDDGVLTMDSGSQMGSYPSFQVVIKGDELSYVIPDATPTIESAQGVEVEEGSSANIEVTVGNEGTGEGDFSVGISEISDGFTGSGIVKDVNLEAGDTTTVELPVSYAEDSDQRRNSGTATIEVANLRDTGEVVTEEVSLTGIQSNECDPGEYSEVYHDDETKTIYICSDDGQSKEEVETCGSEERVRTLEDGTKTCVQDNVDDGDNETDTGTGNPDTVKIWIPTQGNTRCISQVVTEGTQVDPSYDSKSSCQDAISGTVGCAISTPDLVPVTEAEEVDLICGENKVYANVLLTILLGLIGLGTGRKIGGAIDPEDSNSATLILASALGVLGAVIGFAVVSVAQAIGFILAFALIYGVYKAVMIYTGAAALKELLVE